MKKLLLFLLLFPLISFGQFATKELQADTITGRDGVKKVYVQDSLGVGVVTPLAPMHVYTTSEDSILILENTTSGEIYIMFINGTKTWKIGMDGSENLDFNIAGAVPLSIDDGATDQTVQILTSNAVRIGANTVGYLGIGVAPIFSIDVMTTTGGRLQSNGNVEFIMASDIDNNGVATCDWNFVDDAATMFRFRKTTANEFLWMDIANAVNLLATNGGNLGVQTTTAESVFEVGGSVGMKNYGSLITSSFDMASGGNGEFGYYQCDGSANLDMRIADFATSTNREYWISNLDAAFEVVIKVQEGDYLNAVENGTFNFDQGSVHLVNTGIAAVGWLVVFGTAAP